MMTTVEITEDLAIGVFNADVPLGTLELDSSGTLWFTDALGGRSISLTTMPTNDST